MKEILVTSLPDYIIKFAHNKIWHEMGMGHKLPFSSHPGEAEWGYSDVCACSTTSLMNTSLSLSVLKVQVFSRVVPECLASLSSSAMKNMCATCLRQERMMTSSFFRRNNDDVIMRSCLRLSSEGYPTRIYKTYDILKPTPDIYNVLSSQLGNLVTFIRAVAMRFEVVRLQ